MTTPKKQRQQRHSLPKKGPLNSGTVDCTAAPSTCKQCTTTCMSLFSWRSFVSKRECSATPTFRQPPKKAEMFSNSGKVPRDVLMCETRPGLILFNNLHRSTVWVARRKGGQGGERVEERAVDTIVGAGTAAVHAKANITAVAHVWLIWHHLGMSHIDKRNLRVRFVSSWAPLMKRVAHMSTTQSTAVQGETNPLRHCQQQHVHAVSPLIATSVPTRTSWTCSVTWNRPNTDHEIKIFGIQHDRKSAKPRGLGRGLEFRKYTSSGLISSVRRCTTGRWVVS